MIVGVRWECPKCGGRRVPSYETSEITPGRWLTRRQCSVCGCKFKRIEVMESVLRASGQSAGADT